MASLHAGALFNNYFGGSMSSLIFQQIREFRSMAYRANAKYNFPSYKFQDKEGALIASLSTQCDKTTDAMSILDSLIKQMPAKRERVETARQDVINEATNQYPSLRNRSTQIADLKKVGYFDDPNKSLTEDVAQMGLEQIVDFYNSNIKGRPIAYLVVGNSKKIDMQKLSSFGKIIKVKANHVVR
jgi:predicted Zn-dependent peptidase